jgi:porphyrinogen peroxidase
MLRNMFIGDPPGNTDRILDFSTAKTGTLFFVPTIDFLDDPPPLAGSARDDVHTALDETETRSETITYDGSLMIGSLKGQQK